MCHRNGLFYIRRRVPAAVRQQLGQGEIWRSLQTDSLRIALRRLPRIASLIEAEIERARESAGLSVDATLLEPLQDDALPTACLSAISTNGLVGQESLLPPVTLGDAYQSYIDDPTHDWADRTRETYDTTRKLAVSVLGENTPMKNVGRAQIRDLIEVLRFLPRNATKLYPLLSPAQAAERFKREGKGVTISSANANAYISSLSSFMNWAVNEEVIGKNPVRGLRLPDEVAKRDKRNPFSVDQLRLIFNAPLYRGCLNGERGFAVAGAERPQNARYWVPLIALHTGMRLNEICQLDVTDVRIVDGIACIVITKDSVIGSGDKRLKTGTSERVMPIHARLLNLGLVGYAEAKRRTGETKLFAEIDPGGREVRAVAFSKWFTQFLTHSGARRDRTCFHSFRHNYRDELRRARIDHDIAMALGGWTTGSATQGKASDNYGRGHRIEALAEAIARLTFPDIDLSHVAR